MTNNRFLRIVTTLAVSFSADKVTKYSAKKQAPRRKSCVSCVGNATYGSKKVA